MSTEKLRRIDSNRLEIPKGYKAGMCTNGVIYVDETLEKNLEPKAIDQVANVAMLPGIVGSSIAMPDIHTGYGFTIGGVAAFDLKEGVISPGGVGYDINCGVRLLKTELTKKELSHDIKDLIEGLYATIPAGVGSKSTLRLNAKDYKKVLVSGSRWVVEQGYGNNEDIDHTESQGCLEGANPDLISKKAYERNL
jgi:tRNA-splicing ligase RtcB